MKQFVSKYQKTALFLGRVEPKNESKVIFLADLGVCFFLGGWLHRKVCQETLDGTCSSLSKNLSMGDLSYIDDTNVETNKNSNS